MISVKICILYFIILNKELTSQYARVCKSMPEYARVCQSMPEYARVCLSKPEYAKLCQSMPEYARVCQSIPDYARFCTGFINPSVPQCEKNTLWPYVIHGIITEMCDIIIYKRGSTGERTFSTGERTWRSSVTNITTVSVTNTIGIQRD